MSYSSTGSWRKVGRYQQFVGLADTCWRTRAYGDFWSYMLVAEGAVDIAAEPELEVYDMAALVPVVTEAGGRFTSLDGRDGLLGRQCRRDQRAAPRRGPRPAGSGRGSGWRHRRLEALGDLPDRGQTTVPLGADRVEPGGGGPQLRPDDAVLHLAADAHRFDQADLLEHTPGASRSPGG